MSQLRLWCNTQSRFRHLGVGSPYLRYVNNRLFQDSPIGRVTLGEEGRTACQGAGNHHARTEDRHAHAAAELRSSPVDEQHPHQLPEPLDGVLVDPDDAHLPGAAAGTEREPGQGAVSNRSDGRLADGTDGTDCIGSRNNSTRGGLLIPSTVPLSRQHWVPRFKGDSVELA